MKYVRTITIIVILVMLLGCQNGRKGTYVDTKKNTYGSIYKFEFEGHVYIEYVYATNKSASIVHDPNCNCNK